MSIKLTDLIKCVIQPALEDIGLYSHEAESLLLGTCAQESRFGFYLKQYPKGPALGIFQMEKKTHDDIWKNFLCYRPSMIAKILPEIPSENRKAPSPLRLAYDLKYAAQMCRIHYFRIPAKIPKSIYGQAQYWKKFYNTPKGKGTEEEYMKNFERFIGDEIQ